MQNTYSPTTPSLMYTELKRGDIVNASGQIAVVNDVLHSGETGNICLYLMFVHNIGNSRQYDVIELTPERVKAFGVDKWKLATTEELNQAIEKRKQSLDKSFQAVCSLARERAMG
ncbi:MAG: hypothetical protein U0350_13565 [Caldilineaceae bacterium]